MFSTKDGQIYDCVEATMDVVADNYTYTTLTIEWLVRGSKDWQTAQIVDKRMAKWDSDGTTDKVRQFVGMYLDLIPECIARIDVVYA